MSKIEKALRKAQSARKNGILPIKKDLTSSLDQKPVKVEKSLAVKKEEVKSLIKNMGESKYLSFEDLVERRIIFPGGDEKVANSYRALRTKLLQKSKGENFSVLITSCVEGYESSSLTLNISAAFSLDESKTSLVIDCNINKPRIDRMLGIDIESGLTEYIENDDVTVDKIIYSAGIKRLRVIPAGVSIEKNSDYFTSLRMINLLDGLIERYPDRYIFVDAPPVSSSADSKILAGLCDFVVIVVPYAKVTNSQVQACINSVDSEKLVGIVMVDVL